MNKLLDKYYRMLYFRKSKPTTLSQMSNWELEGVLLHIKKYPIGLLNGYDKPEYINAVNYILNCRKQSKDYKIVIIETRLANKALNDSEVLSKELLNMMINTEKQYVK